MPDKQKLLSEKEVAEIERVLSTSSLATFPMTTEEMRALCQTVRALRESLITANGAGGDLFESHLALAQENATLREQLAHHEEINKQLVKDLGRAAGECRSVQDERDTLQSKLAQVEQERDCLRNELNEHLPKCSRGAIIGQSIGVKP